MVCAYLSFQYQELFHFHSIVLFVYDSVAAEAHHLVETVFVSCPFPAFIDCPPVQRQAHAFVAINYQTSVQIQTLNDNSLSSYNQGGASCNTNLFGTRELETIFAGKANKVGLEYNAGSR